MVLDIAEMLIIFIKHLLKTIYVQNGPYGSTLCYIPL